MKIQQLRKNYLTAKEDTAHYSIPFMRFHMIQWMCFIRLLIWFCTCRSTNTTRNPPYDHPIPLHHRTTLHTNMLLHTLIHIKPPNSHHTYFHPIKSYIRHSLHAGISMAQEKNHRIIHKNLLRLNPMCGWNPTYRTKLSGGGTATYHTYRNWKL